MAVIAYRYGDGTTGFAAKGRASVDRRRACIIFRIVAILVTSPVPTEVDLPAGDRL
jgi:hypothetical protein